MPYIHRNPQGNVIGLTRWPSGSSEHLPDDHQDVEAFRNRVIFSREKILANLLQTAPDEAKWGLLVAYLQGN